jgi:ribosomal protein S18 acetylase RimI-like enzyme
MMYTGYAITNERMLDTGQRAALGRLFAQVAAHGRAVWDAHQVWGGPSEKRIWLTGADGEPIAHLAYGLPVWKDFTGPTPTNAAECVRFNWWIRDACELHLFRVAGIPAGFAVSLHEPARLPAGIDHEVVDFYILPKYRGRGYGQAAARQLLSRPGHWQLYTLHANRAAQAFWRDTLRSVAGGYTEPQPGLEFRFEVQPIAAD